MQNLKKIYLSSKDCFPVVPEEKNSFGLHAAEAVLEKPKPGNPWVLCSVSGEEKTSRPSTLGYPHYLWIGGLCLHQRSEAHSQIDSSIAGPFWICDTDR